MSPAKLATAPGSCYRRRGTLGSECPPGRRDRGATREFALSLSQGVREMEERGATIYVGNLPWRTTEDELAQLFRPFGGVRDVRIIQDPSTGRSRGYGFVELQHGDGVRKAVEALDGHELQGRPLMVSVARPKPPRT
jgi:cold-inducible RNA-binding protein